MKYGLIVNPAAGKKIAGRKLRALGAVALRLGCNISGLDTRSREELQEEAKDLCQKVDTLVVAGGDGTLGNILNVIEPRFKIGYIPFGSGNGFAYDFDIPRNPAKAAEKILHGSARDIDLLSANGTKACFSGIGFESDELKVREKLLKWKIKGLPSYITPALIAMLYSKKFNAEAIVDGQSTKLPELGSLHVSKTRHYGYGCNISPRAKPNDGKLHCSTYGSLAEDLGLAYISGMLGRNMFGKYFPCREMIIKTDEDVSLHTSGDVHSKGKEFNFKVLPKELKLVC